MNHNPEKKKNRKPILIRRRSAVRTSVKHISCLHDIRQPANQCTANEISDKKGDQRSDSNMGCLQFLRQNIM